MCLSGSGYGGFVATRGELRELIVCPGAPLVRCLRTCDDPTPDRPCQERTSAEERDCGQQLADATQDAPTGLNVLMLIDYRIGSDARSSSK